MSDYNYLKVNYTAEYVQQLTGLTEEEAQKCLYWIEQAGQGELLAPVNHLIYKYAKGVKSTLLD